MSDEVVGRVESAEEREEVSEKRGLGLQCRESVQGDKQSEVIDDDNECVKMTEQQQLQHEKQSLELVLEEEDVFVIEYRNGSQETQYDGEEEETEVTEQEDGLQSQEPIQADHQLGLGDKRQNEIFGEQMQEVAVVVEEQDTVRDIYRATEEQKEQYNLVIDYKDGSVEKQNEQEDQVNEEKTQEQMQVNPLTVQDYDVEVDNWLHNRDEQNTRVIVGEHVCPNEMHGEVMEHQIQTRGQEIEVAIEEQDTVEEHDRVTEEEAEVSEQELQCGMQSQESVQEEQHSLVIDNKDGSLGQQIAQHDLRNEEKSKEQMQVTGVIVEKQNALVQIYEPTEQQRENEQQGEYKMSEAPVQIAEQQMEHEQRSRELIQEEQHGKMAGDENGSPNQQEGEVNEGYLLIKCQEHIVENQNVPLEKNLVAGEQAVEVPEQETEHGQQNQEQNNKVIISGSSKQEYEQKDEENEQRNQSQIQVTTEIVDNHIAAELTHEVLEEEVEVTKQQRDHGQHSQEEQNSKVINYEYPKQQNEQLELLDGVNGHQVQNQMQDVEVIVARQVDAELKHTVPEDEMEEQSRKTQQQCDVTEEHIECIKRQIQFQEELVEGIEKLTGPEGQQVENVSELQEQIELLSQIFNAGMQESFSKKQEKAAATGVNSSPPLASQKVPYHSSSTFSRENCLELLGMTHKLQEKTLQVQGTLLDLLSTRQSSYTTSKSLIESEETMPGSGGERDYIDCGFLEQMKHHQRRQLSRRGKKAAESDCPVSKEPICQEQHHRDLVQEKGLAVEYSCKTQRQTRQPALQRQLRSQGWRQSTSEILLTAPVVELSPGRDQDTELLAIQVTEKPKKSKRSAENTGQTQLQQRQLRPRGKVLSESKQAAISIVRSMASSSHSQPLYNERYQLISSTARSQVEKPGIESSQLQKQETNHCNRRKRGTPEPTTLPSAIGPILCSKKQFLGCQNVEFPTPESCEDIGKTIMEKSSQPVVPNTDHHGQEKMLKSKPTIIAEITQLNSESVEDLPQTAKELRQKQRCHMSLRSRSQVASQSELVVSITKSLPSEHHYEQQQEMKHESIRWPKLNTENQHNGELQPLKNPEQPRKRRGRPKRKLDVAATIDGSMPAKYHKLQEEPKGQRQETPPNEHPDVLQPLKHQPQKSGRPRKFNLDDDLVTNYHIQRNLRSHKREMELELPKKPEQPQKPRGGPPKENLDVAATEDVSLSAKYKLQEETREQKQKRLSNAHYDELQPLKHSEQPQKRSGRPRKLNFDNELVKNCLNQRFLRSHKREEELQLPKQPQTLKRLRGRPCKSITANELKQGKSHSERRQSKRLKEHKGATTVTEAFCF